MKKDDLQIPNAVKAIQVVISATLGTIVRLYVNNAWLSFFAFILVFIIVYSLIGLIYLKLKK
ncbi:hypothetical protein ACFO26_07160 [Lactococcus nasutitermitis]|uniref:Uncharacterized protein n=1 Tax=Lactococcus nasutitermitis TaxID=1652957 RepID=A0ABV9JGU1_9LACT|nr:hypothetical protein [Lactococcus nasutitermitis]